LNFHEKLNKLPNIFSVILLISLLIIVSLIAYYRVKVQLEIGPMWDTYDFLSNALLFAGKSSGYADLNRPPLLPFLTSIFFRLGTVSEATIFALDGLFFVFGVMGLYLFFKLRFNEIMSFLGALLFATFPIVLLFSGAGLSDIPSVSLSIWALYFTVLAVKKNSKFFYLSFLFAMLAFLTRYTAGLLIFPILFYLLINKKCFKNIKDIFIGIIISLLPLLPVLLFFNYMFGNAFYSFQSFFQSTGTSGLTGSFFYQPDLFFYLKNFLSYVGPVGFAIISIILMGIIIYGLMGKYEIKNRFKRNLSKYSIVTDKKEILIFLILVLIFVFSFSKVHFLISEIIFFLLILVCHNLLKRLEIRFMDLNFLFLLWFMMFFIFHSIYTIKDDRYFVTMAVPVAYFLILGLNEISSRFKYKIKNTNISSIILSVILIAFLLISTVNYVPNILNENVLTKEKVNYTVSASNWLKDYDPDYNNKIIYADYSAYFSWYLKMNVRPMPFFVDGKRYYYQPKDYNVYELSIDYNDELEKNNVDYYLSNKEGLNLTNYKALKQFGFVTIYERIDA
jgi:4-amino-4-deoxy-L-arabinose transferase-like glycosyltransferase